jgi:hypothetical protein
MKKMDNEPLVFIEDGALQRLVDYCRITAMMTLPW